MNLTLTSEANDEILDFPLCIEIEIDAKYEESINKQTFEVEDNNNFKLIPLDLNSSYDESISNENDNTISLKENLDKITIDWDSLYNESISNENDNTISLKENLDKLENFKKETEIELLRLKLIEKDKIIIKATLELNQKQQELAALSKKYTELFLSINNLTLKNTE